MGLSKIFALLIVTSFICVNSTEELRYLDDNFNYTQDIEKENPSEIKMTASLDIKLTGKCESSDPNVFTLIGCNNVHNAGDNNNEIFMEQFRIINEKLANLTNAIRDTNLEIVKIKERSCDNDGFQPTVADNKNVALTRKNESEQVYPKSCKELFDNGNKAGGKYKIQPAISTKPFEVLCDMNIRGGGWTHIQKRYDGSQDFYLGWEDYKSGFGNLDGEFWIGLENIHLMTVQDGTELLVELEDRDGVRAYVHYTSFKIGSEKEGFPLSILNGYSGDAEDALTYHLGMKFSTKDRDQDTHDINCAAEFSGAWWYRDCHLSNLNGKYLHDLDKIYGINWTGFRSDSYSFPKTRMLIKTT